ncbi:MAG: hypothetical protein ABIA93_02605 [Candidatus Woesearchaeota archaeon]
MRPHLTAVKLSAKDIVEGSYVQREGMEPSVLQTRFGDVSRVNLIGVVVQKDSTSEVLVDDGSGQITVRNFDGTINEDVGDIVLVIGRPRSSGGIFLASEIIKKQDMTWVLIRRKELENRRPTQTVKQHIAPVQEAELIKSPNNLVVEAIRTLDKGQGVDIVALENEVNLPNFDEILDTLMKEGDVYEVKGKVRVLE